jgi:hypothetical protein
VKLQAQTSLWVVQDRNYPLKDISPPPSGGRTRGRDANVASRRRSTTLLVRAWSRLSEDMDGLEEGVASLSNAQ